MVQCPVCKVPIPLRGDSCPKCSADLAAYFSLLRGPTEFYNAGVAASGQGDLFEALLSFAAAAKLSDDERPARALADVLAGLGHEDLAARCRGDLPTAAEGKPALKSVAAAAAPVARGTSRWRRAVALAAFLAIGAVLGASWRDLVSRRGTASALAGSAFSRVDTVFVPQPSPRPDVGGVGAASSATRAVAAPPVFVSHVVMPGETLWDIAARYLGDGAAWPRLTATDQRDLRDPRRLQVGTQLLIESPAPVRRHEEGR